MSIAEMKKEITEGIDHLPESFVSQIHTIVKEAEKKFSSKFLKDEATLDMLFDKYDDVFKKLAQ